MPLRALNDQSSFKNEMEKPKKQLSLKDSSVVERFLWYLGDVLPKACGVPLYGF